MPKTLPPDTEPSFDIQEEAPFSTSTPPYIETAMTKQSTFNVDADADYMVCDNRSPERTLLYAILERAVNDLTTIVEPLERGAAITWFETRGVKSTCCFTYDQIIEYLDLSPSILRAIEYRVDLAKRYQRVSDIEMRNKIRIEIEKYVKVRGRRRTPFTGRKYNTAPSSLPPEVNFETRICA